MIEEGLREVESAGQDQPSPNVGILHFMPHRAMIQDHLAKAEQHVAQGRRHVDKQRELVAKLTADGHDTFEARRLLAQFEELLEVHIKDRNRLRAELAQGQ